MITPRMGEEGVELVHILKVHCCQRKPGKFALRVLNLCALLCNGASIVFGFFRSLL